MHHKASFTHSPLARPSSPVHRLANGFADYLYFPDPEPLYAVVGSLVANMLRGSTVWLMLVGPPSCGKTELLKSLLETPQVKEVGAFTEAALLSGAKQKDYTAGARGGLLNDIGTGDYHRGALVMLDFTAILSMETDKLKKALGALQQIYDGRYSRDIGTEGARHLHWNGRVGFLAGTTDVIDRHAATMSENGPRFIFWRYPESDGEGEMRHRNLINDPEEMEISLRVLVSQFLNELSLDWENPKPTRVLETSESERIGAIAQLCVRCRSAVNRDPYSREIISVGHAEYPTRVAAALGQLYLGMEVIGVESTERWKCVRKIALDCMPQNRQQALALVSRGIGEYHEVADKIRISYKTGERVLQDLTAHRLLERVNGNGTWQLTEWTRARLRKGWEEERI